jgi:hypothetical protein
MPGGCNSFKHPGTTFVILKCEPRRMPQRHIRYCGDLTVVLLRADLDLAGSRYRAVLAVRGAEENCRERRRN